MATIRQSNGTTQTVGSGDFTGMTGTVTLGQVTGNRGTTLVDFGAFPGASDASVFVSSPGILSGSAVIASIQPAVTADHSPDEHVFESIAVFAGNVVASSGFTLYAQNCGSSFGVKDGTRLYGKWLVAWTWS